MSLNRKKVVVTGAGGVTTTLFSDNLIKDIPRLVQVLAQQKITRIVLVPSLLQSILDNVSENHSLLPDLFLWTSSGEALSSELANQFRKTLPGKRLLNLYGSSEIAADVTYYDCCEVERACDMPIGRPISNTEIYILDSRSQPVPIGVPGEVYVGGVGLARGYLNRPELTTEKFLQNPFNGNRSFRVYRTGDVARYRADGNIEYLGRSPLFFLPF